MTFLSSLITAGLALTSTASAAVTDDKVEAIRKPLPEYQATKYLYPAPTFGKVNSSACSDAPPCGTIMSYYNGIPAYSNGENQCSGWSCDDYWATGSRYQCVELGQRYMNALYGIAPFWPVNYAKEMCTQYPAGVWPTGSPKAGDLVVFGWGTYGHVAIVSSLNGGTVSVMEQNGSPNGWNTYYMSDVLCFMTAG